MSRNRFIFLIGLLLLLTACNNPKVRERFNLDYATPDEFAVQKQKDLVIPKKLVLVVPSEEVVEEKPTATGSISKSDQEFLNESKY